MTLLTACGDSINVGLCIEADDSGGIECIFRKNLDILYILDTMDLKYSSGGTFLVLVYVQMHSNSTRRYHIITHADEVLRYFVLPNKAPAITKKSCIISAASFFFISIDTLEISLAE